MKASDIQQKGTQNQPATQQRKGTASLESPQGDQISQLEAMAESSPQADKLAQLATMANNSPQATAQRRLVDAIQNGLPMTVQRKAVEGIHGSPHATAQRQQFDSLPGETAQREEAEETLQPKVAQREEASAKPNNTGLPDNLKSGIESLSGISMDNVKVHYNSSQPAQLNAHAYAQGTDIHVAPGQEQHLPHEAWHVVQQAQGRVQPTMQMKGGVPINDDKLLEHEADVMGAKASSTMRRMDSARVHQMKYSPIQYIQLKNFGTHIEHKAKKVSFNDPKIDSGSDIAGIEMTAKLDADDPVVGSGTDQDEQLALMNYIRKKYKISGTSWVKGHLLNHDLGGFGVAENLYPITSIANGAHKRFAENPVGKWLKEAQNPSSLHKGVFYSVTVENFQDNADKLVHNASTFVCKAHQLDKNGKKTGAEEFHRGIPSLLSHYIPSTTSSHPTPYAVNTSGTTTGLTSAESISTKYIATGWDHKNRAGKEADWGTYISQKKIKVVKAELANKGFSMEQIQVGLRAIDRFRRKNPEWALVSALVLITLALKFIQMVFFNSSTRTNPDNASPMD